MIWNALHGMNGLTCLGLVLLPFILLGVVGYENSRKRRRAKIRAVTYLGTGDGEAGRTVRA